MGGEVIKHSKSVKRFGCVGSCVLQKNGFYNGKKSTHSHVGGFCNKMYKSVFILPLFFAPLLQINFSELGQMLLHPTVSLAF